MPKAFRGREYKKILVVRFSSLGDIVLTTPTLMALRRRYPDTQLDFLLKEQYAPLLENHPSNCGIILLTDEIRRNSAAYLKFCDGLRDEGYDLVVDLQGNGRSYVLRRRLFCDWVKIKKRTLARLLLVKFGLGRDRRPDIRRIFLDTIKKLGVNVDNEPSRAILGVSEDERARALEILPAGFADVGKVIAIHPGARWELKEWGRDKFRKLAEELIERGYNIFFLGEEIEINLPQSIFLGKTNLRELMALIAMADVFVGNDSGPLHIAEGVGTKAVGIFGPTHPSLGYAPNHKNAVIMGIDLKCRPCTLFGSGRCKFDIQTCMSGIEVKTVANAVENLYCMQDTEIFERRDNMAVFLDRDGTVIVDAHFLDDPDRIELLPGAAEGIRLLNEAGLPVVIVTNQSGVARGYFGTDTVEAVNGKLVDILAERGAKIDGIYYCPHHPEGEVPEFSINCRCRKPAPGLAETAAEDFNLDLKKCFVIGDKASDMKMAQHIGSTAILVRTGKGRETEAGLELGDVEAVFDCLTGAAEYVVNQRNKL